jgi:hypothetical protein
MVFIYTWNLPYKCPEICHVGFFLKDHETLSKVCHVGLHVTFSSMKSSLGLKAFTFV